MQIEARAITVAEAVKNLLNAERIDYTNFPTAGTATQEFLVFERGFVHNYDVDDLPVAKATVVPRSNVTRVLNRAGTESDLQIDVVYQHLCRDVTSGVGVWDNDMWNVEQIRKALQFCGAIASGTGWTANFYQVSVDPLFHEEHIEQMRVFTSVVSVDFKVIEIYSPSTTSSSGS